MRWVKFLLSLLLTLAFGWALLTPMGSTPFALGAFFDPFVGFWSNAEPIEMEPPAALQLPGIEESVEVSYDERRVPHIFANNRHDLFMAQGYLTAKDRLWQMEFQTMAAAGRLTEIVGRGEEDAVLNLDRAARRKGLVFGAERSLEKMKDFPETMQAIEAYAEGVNAYIDGLDLSALPIEYKLLGYEPEEWTPFKSALLLKYMANSLTWRSYDIPYTHAMQLFGKEVFETLYPDFQPGDEPIVPNETRWRRRDALPPTPLPEEYEPDSILLSYIFEEEKEDDQIVGSNNWAVGPSKSKSGHAMLANDPHLSLNLPSLWYEVQLNCPGMNTYGASLPGSPCVIIGFNDSVSWGVTNGSRDVIDHYTITYRDDRKADYLYDGQWLPVKNRIEEHKIKGGGVYHDTVRYTHLGPVMYDESYAPKGKPLAIRWMAHEPSNELQTFFELNQANNYQDYLNAIETYICPAQNFVFASVKGNIAIWQQGKFPHKWTDQGKFILDGSREDHMWKTFIPQQDNPHAFNPPQGFVQSANQRPTSQRYPYETFGRYEDFRGRRLVQLLSEKDSLDLEDMKAIQLDNYYQGAAEFLPFLLSQLDTLALSSLEKRIFEELKAWDFQYDSEQAMPAVYETWWDKLFESIWEDELRASPLALSSPKARTTMNLLRDSINLSYIQVVGDTTRYSRAGLINSTFNKTIEEFAAKSDNPADWTWSSLKKTDIRHLSRTLTPFGRYDLPTNGKGGVLNATGTLTGPSWRMVIEMGPEPRAYGIYPGGQSGNPGSPAYDAFIDDWVEGNYYKLNFMSGPDEGGEYQTLTIKKK